MPKILDPKIYPSPAEAAKRQAEYARKEGFKSYASYRKHLIKVGVIEKGYVPGITTPRQCPG